MKIYKVLAVGSILFFTMCLIAMATPQSKMPLNSRDGLIPVFSPHATVPVVTIAGAGDVDVSAYTAVMFGSDLNIYFGADSSNPYPYVANMSIGVTLENWDTIHVDAACAMLGM